MTNVVCREDSGSECHFSIGLCDFTQDEDSDDVDWAWHEGAGVDDPFLPDESERHDGYIYINPSAVSAVSGSMSGVVYGFL